MRVLIITNVNSRFSVPLINNLSGNGVLAGVILFDNVKSKKIIQLLQTISLREFLHLSSRYIFNIIRFSLIKVFGKWIKVEPSSSQEAVVSGKIPYIKLKELDSSYALKQIDDFKPDIILVASLSEILKKEVINIPTKGTLNIHTSILPHHRGPRPVFWSMLKGESKFGFSIHEVTEKIDAGNVIFQKTVPISEIKSESKINRALFNAVDDVIFTCLKIYYHGEYEAIEMSQTGNYESFPEKEDLDSFIRKGFTY